MSKVSLGGTAYEPVEVDLWDVQYTTVPLTRSVSLKTDSVQDRINAAVDQDELVAAIGDLLDLRLQPTVKGSRKPKTLVAEKWKADAVTIDQLFAFLANLGEADRPT